ncbi:39S ribosomal protein L50, mitochondrial [Aphelenchoides fujianensis]|nr:39S ribosomal protein L50, mitochondrial [Aphelenchoides fujianensis]
MLQRSTAVRLLIQRSFWKRSAAPKPTGEVGMGEEEKEALGKKLQSHVVAERPADEKQKKRALVERSEAETAAEMDAIRARGFLPYTYNYDPPSDLAEIITKAAETAGISASDEKFANLEVKSKLLLELGAQLKHYVPSNKLLYLETLEDVRSFYAMPVRNTTTYQEMARDMELPANLAIRENPARFHPNDAEAVHGGVTALPGSGGKIFGLRNKRLYRQFRPKIDWFDYEDQNFQYEAADAQQPWHPEVASKMDRYTDRKFSKKGFTKL